MHKLFPVRTTVITSKSWIFRHTRAGLDHMRLTLTHDLSGRSVLFRHASLLCGCCFGFWSKTVHNYQLFFLIKAKMFAKLWLSAVLFHFWANFTLEVHVHLSDRVKARGRVFSLWRVVWFLSRLRFKSGSTSQFPPWPYAQACPRGLACLHHRSHSRTGTITCWRKKQCLFPLHFY